MAINRRTFLTGVGAGVLGALAPMSTWGSIPRRLYLSARADQTGAFRVAGFDGTGRLTFDLPLPGRGHSLAIHPERHQAAIFARRPGSFAIVLDLDRGGIATTIQSAQQRHFYGHGVFRPDGRLLYATENDYSAERGMIGVYDTGDRYRRVGEFPSYGIGPHELQLFDGGKTMVVANGGILTHPDLPRAKLNLATMRPSLVYLDPRNGTLLGQFRFSPELHQLSIRHLATGSDNCVAIALQYEGPSGDRVPLVAFHRGKGNLVAATAPDQVWQHMRQYCGSVAFDRSEAVLAVSAPRGNQITFWNSSGRYLSSVAVEDGCGVTAGARPLEFLVTSGTGVVMTLDIREGSRPRVTSDFATPGSWDNHLVNAI